MACLFWFNYLVAGNGKSGIREQEIEPRAKSQGARQVVNKKSAKIKRY
jgi:hypothetical protein